MAMPQKHLEKYRYIKWFDQISAKDVSTAGGKGANLGEMTRLGLPVPPGFVVSAEAYNDFIAPIRDEIAEALKELDFETPGQLRVTSKTIKDLILLREMPAEISEEIRKAYMELCEMSHEEMFVAVRSSATAEDLPKASFAGEQATFLNVLGEDNLVRAVHKDWASLWEPRAIFYRHRQNFEHMDVSIAVPVQKMVDSEASGVMFTIDPSSNDTGKIVIEAAFGLGEVVVGGQVNVDSYVIEKESLEILEREIGWQAYKIVRLGSENVNVDLFEEEKEQQKISDREIIELCEYGKKLEDHYKTPQDIEWATEKGKVYIVQTRAVTTITERRPSIVSAGPDRRAKPVLQGLGASPGMASGEAKIVMNPEELDKIEKGDVLVTEMTSPDFVPAIEKASAIVTDSGGRTSHAAIVSREMGIPSVIGTHEATTMLQDGQMITVDGSRGNVYEGKIEEAEKPPETEKAVAATGIVTGTKIYVNLAEPELAEKIAAQDVDGVGLLRAEFMIAKMKTHPMKLAEEGRQEEFIGHLTEGITRMCRAFDPRPVTYRTNDFKTNEYRNMEGGEKFEPQEENPMIGFRGCSRYAIKPAIFEMELEAIKRVSKEFENLQIMLPFVRTVEELKHLREVIEEKGLLKKHFKLWMMVEVPSTVFLIEEFLPYVDGVSIGSNDLTQLILGVDRDSEVLAPIFDERDPAVMKAMETVVRTCHWYGKTSSICGQAPSEYPEIASAFVEWGATSVSVNPDVIEVTRKIVAQAEHKKLLEAS